MSTTIANPKPTLTQLAEEINQKHYEAEASLTAGLIHAVRAGELLTQAKAQCKHGDWIPWLEDNFVGSVRNAQAYMRVVDRREEIESKSAGLANLGFEEALQLTAEPKDEETHDDRLTELLKCEKRIEANLPGALAWLDKYENVLAGIPKLSPDNVLLGVDEETQRLIHFEPSVVHRGYYHLLVMTPDKSKEGWIVDYDKRPAKYTREILARVLITVHQAYPEELIPCPADGQLFVPGFEREDAITRTA